jgi:predicted N-formylglutamate amidohydrolase
VLDINNKSVADLVNVHGDSRYFIICEHASKNIPDRYNKLGLSDADINRHIGWDIGAQGVAEHLSKLLNAPLVLQTQSRLLYDCNRPPCANSAIPKVTEQTPVPGNNNLSDEQIQARADDIYYPFHQSISDLLDNRSANLNSIIVTIHSFNPIYNGQERSLDIGIINDENLDWAQDLTTAAQQFTDISVKLNEPYSATDGVTHTLQLHGRDRQLHNVMIEIKNNLIDSEDGQLEFAKILAKLLQENLPKPT